MNQYPRPRVALLTESASRSAVLPAQEWEVQVVLEGCTASAAQTSLPLRVGTEDLGAGSPGVPVVAPAELGRVGVAWASGSTPAGDWTLTFWRRTNGGSFNAAATFSVRTS